MKQYPTPFKRPRRNRKSAAIRSLVQESRLHPSQLVAPLFVLEGRGRREPIASMPGIERLSIDCLIEEAALLYRLGIRAVDLFPYIPRSKKDAVGSEALRRGNLMQSCLEALKKELPDLCLMADIALDPYTEHGHDGCLSEEGEVDNDRTLELLAEMSLLAAEAGADVVAPSDMMDGRIRHIREALDGRGFYNTSILSYTAKYASPLYAPFREALHSAPKFGDKRTYQMNPANRREALLEAALDEDEGADLLLVKPALPYLDVLCKIREATPLPLGAYHVSGEYALVMAAAANGWVDAGELFLEALLSIRRAGADFILTYAAKQAAFLLNSEKGEEALEKKGGFRG